MQQRSNFLVGMILVIWFVISFVTNILGPLMPVIIHTYQLSLTMAALLPFSFFIAYGLMSIPAGVLIERLGEKKATLIAFTLNLGGTLLFASYPRYEVALPSLFIIGIGMAMLQVIINPLMRTAGGEENFAFFSVLGQLVFGLASFVSPFVFSYFMHVMAAPSGENKLGAFLNSIIQADLQWTALYWLFACLFLIILFAFLWIRIPPVERKEDEKSGAVAVYADLLKKRDVWLFFLAIIAYVGTEQSLANWMSEFLNRYHQVDPATGGASVVAWFWGMMTAGCLVGLAVLKLWDGKRVLQIACLLSMILLMMALFGNSTTSIRAFTLLGATISVMFSIVFSLALNSTKKHHGSFSGILCSGIFGGALVPFIVGALGDIIGLRYGMLSLLVTLGYLFYVATYAKPLITNKTVKLSELLRRSA